MPGYDSSWAGEGCVGEADKDAGSTAQARGGEAQEEGGDLKRKLLKMEENLWVAEQTAKGKSFVCGAHPLLKCFFGKKYIKKGGGI